MAILRIYALGQLRVFYDQTPLHFPTKKTQDLLCFLLLHVGKMLDRDMVAERLWPMRTPGRARRCLSTTLWRLRQTLEPLDPSAFLVDNTTLAFDSTAGYWFDVETFERRATLGLAGPVPCSQVNQEALEEALKLYRGDLLPGCYEDWCLVERERLRLLLLRVLRRLQRHSRLSGAFEVAVSYGHRLLALDPLQEDVHRELMRCYVASGQRPLALEQFRRCRRTLHHELDIEPMPETWNLYRRIRNDPGIGPLPASVEGDSASLAPVLKEFRQALDVLESTWQALRAATVECREPVELARTNR